MGWERKHATDGTADIGHWAAAHRINHELLFVAIHFASFPLTLPRDLSVFPSFLQLDFGLNLALSAFFQREAVSWPRFGFLGALGCNLTMDA